jgi:formylglycine-generating enzyme required for sulfatase activity
VIGIAGKLRSRVLLAIVFAIGSAGLSSDQLNHAGVDSSPSDEQRVAIVVGVGDYPPESGLSQLRYSVNDAKQLAAELNRLGYVVRLLVDREATRSFILRALRESSSLFRNERGTVIFFFSGHGLADAARTNYLATYGASAQNIPRYGLKLDEVISALESSGARQRMLWIDACRNATSAGAKSVANARGFVNVPPASGTRMLFSTSIGGISYENDEFQQGVFTHFLIQGLQGKAADSDGVVTFRRLASYVRRSAQKWSYERGQLQIPEERSDEAVSDFILGKWSGTIDSRPRAEDTPPPLGPSPASIAEGDIQANAIDGEAYVFIPAGSFEMGCSAGDPECSQDERPLHSVRISHGFWLGQSEVTVSSYLRYARSLNGSLPLSPPVYNPGWQNPNLPMVGVTWRDADAFCTWAGGRLPSEAEWEYAARGHQPSSRYGAAQEIGWSRENTRSYGASARQVRTLAPNAFGLYDVLGNVWEFVNDWYGEYSINPGLDPSRPGQGTLKIIRGGSFANPSSAMRSSARATVSPSQVSQIVGWRCACDRLP